MRVTTALRTCLLVFAASAATGCDDDRRTTEVPLAPTGVGPNALATFVSVSNPKAAAGEQVVVAVRVLRGTNVGPVGSYTLRLEYDAAGLQFVEASRASAGMVAVNSSTAGRLVAAGASSQGFTDDELFAATFTVKNPASLSALQLDVSELNSVAFEDHRSAMRVERGVFRLPHPAR